MGGKPLLRQLFLCSGPCAVNFMQGLCAGLPTVLVPQLRRANQTITMEQASWLPSLHIYYGIPWLIILSVFLNFIGRKKSHIAVCISALITFIIFFFSTNVKHFFIGAIFHGAISGSTLTTNTTIITEFISSKYRGIFSTLKVATLFWGILVANTIGTFYHWQNITIVGLVCAVYTVLNVIVWPESPLWLASKGRFAECSAAHRWLKGEGEEAEKELQELIKSHDNRLFVNQQWSVRHYFTTICRRQFLKPILLSNLLLSIHCFSGKVMCIVYAIEVLKSIFNNESSAYSGMLILDGVTVASMYFGCILSKFLNRRSMLLGFSTVGITTMICISIYLYLVKLTVIEENIYFSIILLAIYSIAISCGPMLMSTTIIGELLPLESRILSLCMIASSFKLTYGTFTKLSPYCFKYLGIHGAFTLFSILSIISLALIYFFVPETKDKTLHEINECLKIGEKKEIEENNGLISK